jgi:tripartite-type tricarboxylate transporter receptor subunit TctC
VEPALAERRTMRVSTRATIALVAVACVGAQARAEDQYPSRLITIVAPMGGRIEASFVPLAFVLPLLQDGRLRALAVAAKEPVVDPIGIPTALSQGVDYQYATWYGILAPGKTPRPVLATLNQAIAEASKDPELQAKIRAQGIELRDLGLDRFDSHIRSDMARLDPLLRTIAERR